MIDRKEIQFVAANLLMLAVSGIFLILVSRDGAMDFAVSRFFFDFQSGAFPLKEDGLTSLIGHTGLRWLVLMIWGIYVLTAMAGCGTVKLRNWRSPLVFFCITVALTTAAVSLLKGASKHSCPWDILKF